MLSEQIKLKDALLCILKRNQKNAGNPEPYRYIDTKQITEHKFVKN